MSYKDGGTEKSSIGLHNNILSQEMLTEIDNLLKNEYDWDGIDYEKPTLEGIIRAKAVMIDFVSTISYHGHLLKRPYISNSEDGGAKFEWHLDKRSLYMRINQKKSVVTRIWDKQERPVADADLWSSHNLLAEPLVRENYLFLWEWIINGNKTEIMLGTLTDKE